MTSERLSTEEIALMLAALNRSIARLESEARYAKSGKGANSIKNVSDKAKKMKAIRDRMLNASGITLLQP